MNDIYTGAIVHEPSPKDYDYSPLGMASNPFDWSKGYDVENEVGKIPVKDQKSSYSCGGQAGSYYLEVINSIKTGKFKELSAHFLYAPIAVPGGGSSAPAILDRSKKVGDSSEALCPSLDARGDCTEAFMQDTSLITPIAIEDAKGQHIDLYSYINDYSIETLAKAIRDNHGIIIGVYGKDNGSWHNKFPQVPDRISGCWAHWVYCFSAKTINGRKFIGFINSWGDKIGDRGQQYLGEEWSKFIWSAFAEVINLQDKPYQFLNDLTIGSTGQDVIALQKLLVKSGDLVMPPNTPFGFYGQITKSAVAKFQLKHGITPSVGYTGIKTRTVLNNMK